MIWYIKKYKEEDLRSSKDYNEILTKLADYRIAGDATELIKGPKRSTALWIMDYIRTSEQYESNPEWVKIDVNMDLEADVLSSIDFSGTLGHTSKIQHVADHLVTLRQLSIDTGKPIIVATQIKQRDGVDKMLTGTNDSPFS